MKKALVAVACIGIIGMANAAHDDTHAYIGLQGGVARLNDEGDLKVSDAGIGRLFGGYQFHENGAIEVGTLATGDFSAYGGNIKGSVTGVDMAMIAKHSSGLYAKIGGYHGTMIATGYGQRFTEKQTNALYGVGYEHDLSKNVSADIGITRYVKAFDTVTLGIRYKF